MSAKSAKPMQKKQAAAMVPESEHSKLHGHARSQGRSFADWLREAMAEKAEREGVDLGNSTPNPAVATAN